MRGGRIDRLREPAIARKRQNIDLRKVRRQTLRFVVRGSVIDDDDVRRAREGEETLNRANRLVEPVPIEDDCRRGARGGPQIARDITTTAPGATYGSEAILSTAGANWTS